MKTLIERAEKFRESGDFKESLRLWKKIYQGSLKKMDSYLALDSIIALADIYRIMGSFKKSEKFYLEALDVAEGLDDELSFADALTGLALSKKAVGHWKEALKIVRKARLVYQKNKDNSIHS